LADKYPEVMFVGRINFEGMPVSCSKTRKGIKEGIYSGWDDIQLPFLLALRKRGYQPEAFVKYAIEVGISMADKKVSKEEYFKTINSHNKDIIDPISNRYFFVWNPKHITISGAPKQKVELDLHPQNTKGGRKFSTHDKFFISEEDFNDIKEGRLCRLMDCLNFKKEKSSFVSEGNDYRAYKEKGGKIMHWLPDDDSSIKVDVLMEDNTKRKGLGEHTMSHLKEGDIIQFERFGFVRLVEKHKDKMLFYFLHK
jgi:glutamyl-tRNA synthetase